MKRTPEGDPGVGGPLAGTRPVFRGLRRCLRRHSSFTSSGACRDETRFQGIATNVPPPRRWRSPCLLAGTRPVFRGLRRASLGLGHSAPPPLGLQGRDPFSGDCDTDVPGWTTASLVGLLAGTRSVFRGLRHLGPPVLGPPGEGRLAGTRPVFRGLRPDFDQVGLGIMVRQLAGTRPVFRGLRRARSSGGKVRWKRLQLAGTRPVFRGLRLRPFRPRLHAGDRQTLAGTRPVFRGLRLRIRRSIRFHCSRSLQGRDPFSGDCN